VAYTVTLTNSEDSIEIKSTTNPIVITVPEGEWEIDIEAEATGDGWSSFAERPPKFFGKTWIKNNKKETVTIDTSAMNPSIQVKTWDQLSKAFNGEWDKFLRDVGWKSKSNPQEYYIELLEGGDANTPAILDGDSDKNIVLWADKNNDVTIKRGSNTGSLFQVKKGTLTLGRADLEKDEQGTITQGKITIDGDRASTASSDSLITVFGNLVMYGGVTLTKNATPGNGGGVRVGSGGKFSMHGGEISFNNSGNTGIQGDYGGGGGVFVDTGGEFTMYGGSIFSNTTTGHGGGVRVREGGKFVMEKGEIHTNTSVDFGGGVRVRGTFTMKKDGSIYDNTVKGSNSTSDGRDGRGGGVAVADTGNGRGSFFMEGGIIRNNTASGFSDSVGTGYGGGVFVGNAGTFTRTDGTTIRDNNPHDMYPQQ
jgi:hypothetical protein